MLRKFCLTAIGLSLILYLAIGLLLRWGQTRLIFLPDSHLKSTPREYGLNYQDVWLDLDRAKIHGWWIEAREPTAPVLLYFHGNGSNNGDFSELASIFYQLGVSVLLIDYRGYGQSSPIFPNEARVYEDAEATWRYLTQKRQIEPERIFVYGHSLGGAIAIELATKHPEMAGLIVEGTFTSMKDMAEFMPLLKIFPLDLLITQCFDSMNKIRTLQVPILILHGTADRTIPVSMAKELFASAPQPKQLEIIPLANHNNLPEIGDRQYSTVLKKFIESIIEKNLI